MALNNTGWKLSVTLADQGGNRSTLRYDLQAATHLDANTAANVVVAALNAITTAQVVAWGLAEQYVEDTQFYGVGEVENIALIVAKLTSLGKTANLRIPAADPAIFVAAEGPDYNAVDPANANLIAYLNVFEAGAQAYLSDGENLSDMTAAGAFTGKRIHRGSTKG